MTTMQGYDGHVYNCPICKEERMYEHGHQCSQRFIKLLKDRLDVEMPNLRSQLNRQADTIGQLNEKLSKAYDENYKMQMDIEAAKDE